MTKKQAEQQDAPSLLLDAHGNPNLVAPGELIESAWGNSVVGRVVPRFPNKTALDTYSATVGTLAVTTDLNVVWMRAAGVWRPTAMGNRISFRVIGGGAGQSIPAATLTTVTWTTVASDPFGVLSGGGIFICPTGWDGRWRFDWAVEWGIHSGSRTSYLSVPPSARYGEATAYTPVAVGPNRMSGSASLMMTAGQSSNIVMYHDGAAAVTCNPGVNQHFQGHYVGPF